MMKLMMIALPGLCLVLVSIAAVETAELRGLWVDAFHPGFGNAAETTAMVNKAKSCNFNALFVQVRKRGDVYYTSAIEPTAQNVASGYDPLADIVTKAHAVGLEVHAWLTVYEVHHDVPECTADARQVHVRHPDWLTRDSRGRTKFPGDKVYLDPGASGVE